MSSGVSPKEAQTLARHSTPDLTFNVYGRAREDRLSELGCDDGIPIRAVRVDFRAVLMALKEGEGLGWWWPHEADLIVYLAGADPFEDDQLGNLTLSKKGLRQRDRLVLRTMRGAGVPVAIVLAGGYARQLVDTVDIHVATIEEALTTCR